MRILLVAASAQLEPVGVLWRAVGFYEQTICAAAEYMALPASQYSVLDAERIERLDDNSFRCYVGGLRLFSLVVEPVLTVSVVVGERGPTVKLLETRVRSLGVSEV